MSRTNCGKSSARGALRHALLFLLALFLLAFAGCAPAPEHGMKSAPLRIGSTFWPGSYWIDVAWKKGWFAQAGLAVERLDVDDDYFGSLDQMAAGKLDAIGIPHFDLVRHAAAGHDFVGVVAVDYSDGAEALVVRAGINNVRELKGKRVALRKGTYLEYLFAIVAERAGLDFNDVVLVDLPTHEGPAELAAGRVDAIVAWEPYIAEAQKIAGGKRLFSTADFPGLAYSTLALRREYIDAHPGHVQALVEVWRRTTEYIRNHPEETCELVAKISNDSIEEARALMRVDRILDVADNDRAFSYAAGFDSLHGSWRRMNDYMLDRGLVSRRVSSTDHLDSQFIHALRLERP